jgi:copper transporter 1
MTIAYFLMLIMMTFNSWLCLAVILGSTTGFFLFGWRKSDDKDIGEDHQH